MKPFLAISAFTISVASVFAANTDGGKAPTFSKEVAPILYNRCVNCHRPGEAAPMALREYKEVRPWAKAIKQQVATRTMPPWHADPAIDKFSNDRRLTDAEVATIVKWVDAGAPEGNSADLPKLPEFTDGWAFGKPDMVLDTGTDYPIPAQGVVAYQYFKVDPGFKEDTWIQAAEARPSQRSQVHHILVFVQQGKQRAVRGGEQFSDMLIGYAPGVPTITWDPDTAFLVKAGSTLLFQVHYTTNGAPGKDRSRVGLIFANDPPRREIRTGLIANAGFAIPPGAAAHQVEAEATFLEDVKVWTMHPHMHLRGKDMTYTAIYADGRREIVLRVPKYDFGWQTDYWLAEPITLPKGSKLHVSAHFDNSPANRANPDPKATVRWGDQTWEEMMIGFFTYTVEGPASTTSASR